MNSSLGLKVKSTFDPIGNRINFHDYNSMPYIARKKYFEIIRSFESINNPKKNKKLGKFHRKI